jgi:hypothetical protein
MYNEARSHVCQRREQTEIERIENPGAVKSIGVYFTPAIIVDGEARVTGKVPTVDQIKKHPSE